MSTKLWAGRFNKGINDEVLKYTATTETDQRLSLIHI